MSAEELMMCVDPGCLWGTGMPSHRACPLALGIVAAQLADAVAVKRVDGGEETTELLPSLKLLLSTPCAILLLAGASTERTAGAEFPLCACGEGCVPGRAFLVLLLSKGREA